MTWQNYYLPLEQDCLYHIFNRGNNKENIFYSQRNYDYFLLKFQQHLNPYLELFAYCLLPNHFHCLIRIKEVSSAGRSIQEAFRHFFMGYAKAINKQESRTGSLFQKNFKRKNIASKEQLITTLLYIHTNPTHHRMMKDFRQYRYSSYQLILMGNPGWLKASEVLEWFNRKEEYILAHERYAGRINERSNLSGPEDQDIPVL